VPSQTQIRQEITKRIIEALEKGVKPWRRPWTISPNTGRPMNAVSGKLYNGINPLLLDLHSTKFGFRSRYFASFRQWADLMGCTIKKRPKGVAAGHWGCSIVLWKPLKKIVRDRNSSEEQEEEFMLMRSFVVFNAEQIEGKAAEKFQVKDEPASSDVLPNFAPAEELIAATGAEIRHGGDRAYYCRPLPEGSWPNHTGGDFICVPEKHRFNPVGAYWETLIHEAAHWSECRLDWKHQEHGYAAGELVAEIAASFLATELNIPQAESLENHAAYLQPWLAAMKDDHSFIFKASTQASKVSDYLLSFVSNDEPVGVN
jgi:antirestriction protein ArdC